MTTPTPDTCALCHRPRDGWHAATTHDFKPRGEKTPDTAEQAALRMDWQQVILNGGPPCFYLEWRVDHSDGRFCGRAERWAGHTDKDEWPEHRFVSLAALIRDRDEARAELEKRMSLHNDSQGKEVPQCIDCHDIDSHNVALAQARAVGYAEGWKAGAEAAAKVVDGHIRPADVERSHADVILARVAIAIRALPLPEMPTK